LCGASCFDYRKVEAELQGDVINKSAAGIDFFVIVVRCRLDYE